MRLTTKESAKGDEAKKKAVPSSLDSSLEEENSEKDSPRNVTNSPESPAVVNEGVVPSPPVVTRSGRTVRKPKMLETFVTNKLSRSNISTSNEKTEPALTPINTGRPPLLDPSLLSQPWQQHFNRNTTALRPTINTLKTFTCIQKKASQPFNVMAALDILEEGELSDISVSSNEEKKDKKYDFVSSRTYERAKELVGIIKRKGQCCMCSREFEGRREETIRIHAWSHLVLFVCKCGYHASRYDTVRHHSESNHGKSAKIDIYKVDRNNWSEAREILMIPTKMPSLPLEQKETITTKKGKENKVPRRSSPRKAKLIDVPIEKKQRLISPIKTPVQVQLPTTSIKITKVDNQRTVSTQTSPIKDIPSKEQLQKTEKDIRKFVRNQNTISIELRKMAEAIEVQTDTFRQFAEQLSDMI